jgi:hypothetical protein
LLDKYSSPHPLQFCYGEIARRDINYLKFYQRMAAEKKVVILDYSPRLPRTTRGFGIQDMVKLAVEVHPRFIVLPCVEFNSFSTLAQSRNAAGYLSLALPKDLVGKIGFLALPQGGDKGEIEKNAKDLLEIDGVRMLGLSATLELVYPREELNIPKNKAILLDVYNLLDDEIQDRGNWGFISSLPIRLGIGNQKILDKCSQVELNFNLDGDTPVIAENMESFLDYLG